ncbi:MAG TPA: hypothetical protein VI504_11915 [Candidatus Eisenbacteria bacterium]
MSRHALRAGLVLLVAMGLAGCGKSTTAPVAPPTDQSQVDALLTQGYGLVDDGITGSAEAQGFSFQAGDPNGTFAAIHPLYFWRTLTSETFSWTISFSDTDASGHPTTALALVPRHLLGDLNLVHSIPGDSTVADTANVVHKPLDDHWVRHVRFKRVPIPTLGETRWRFAGTSLVEVTSDVNTTRIQSVHVQTSTLDTTLTDPAALFRLRDVLRIGPSDSVRVTVTTNHPDDVVLLHHADHRRPFRNNGDGTYSIRWVTGPLGGWRHFGVDAIAHATLFDDAAGYDSNRWVIPFVVTSQTPVDYYP